MPGLIDAHWHSVFAALPVSSLFAADVGYIFLAASAEAERTLMRGFTTIRDLGGPSFPLKQAIDEGIVPGPRIYPCGAMITTTGGHGDLRPLQDIPRSPGRPAEPDGGNGRRDDRRQRGRGSPARARAAAAGRFPDQARRRGRRVVAAHVARHDDIQRARVAGGGRVRRRLEHLCRRARLCAADDPAGDRGGSAMHRARPSDGRGDGEADGGEGHLAQHSALPQRRGHGRADRPEPDQPASGLRRHGHSLCAGEGAQDQDGVRLGSPVFKSGSRRARA